DRSQRRGAPFEGLFCATLPSQQATGFPVHLNAERNGCINTKRAGSLRPLLVFQSGSGLLRAELPAQSLETNQSTSQQCERHTTVWNLRHAHVDGDWVSPVAARVERPDVDEVGVTRWVIGDIVVDQVGVLERNATKIGIIAARRWLIEQLIGVRI